MHTEHLSFSKSFYGVELMTIFHAAVKNPQSGFLINVKTLYRKKEPDLIKKHIFLPHQTESGVLKCLSCLSVFKTLKHQANRIETTSPTTSNTKLKPRGEKLLCINVGLFPDGLFIYVSSPDVTEHLHLHYGINLHVRARPCAVEAVRFHPFCSS